MYCVQQKVPSNMRGFTLIEMLVVLVIIGVVIAVATISFSAIDRNRQVVLVAEQMRDSVSAAQSQAVLMPAVLALQLNARGYQFYRYVRDQQGFHWQKLPQDELSHTDVFARHAVVARIMQLSDNNSLVSLTKQQPRRIIFSDSGDVTPFSIEISDKRHTVKYLLTMNAAGKLQMRNITGQEEST